MHKQTPYQTGLNGEATALKYLTANGYTIIAKRFKTPHGEIDLIATHGQNLIAIEVKKRKNQKDLPFSITKKSQQRIGNAMEYFLQKNSDFHEIYTFIRFDVILLSSLGYMQHIQNAWEKF